LASAIRDVFSNRNVMAISLTNMLYNVFNQLWNLWWSLYLVEVLDTPIVIVGLLSTIQMSGSFLFQLPGGFITDRYGRKKVIVYGTCLRVFAALILYSARSWQWVLPGIILNGMAGIYNPAFSAIIADSMPRERRGTAFGTYRMMTSIPGVFMPVVSGYYLDRLGIQVGVRTGLLMFAVATTIAVLVRAKYLEETLDTSKTKENTQNKNEGLLKNFTAQPRIIYFMLLVSIISGFIMRMSWSFLPIYAYNVMGLTTTQYGLLQSIASFISSPLYMVGGMLSDRVGRIPCILLARGFGPLDSLSLLFLRDYNQLIAVFGTVGLIEGLGGGRIRGGGFMGGPAWEALLADIVPQQNRGKVNGMLATISGLATLPASYIGGLIYDINPNTLLGLTAIQLVTIPIILLFFKEPDKDTRQ
jgi:MFS family permease